MRAADWDEKWRGRLTEARHAETTGDPNRFLVAVAEGLPAGRVLDLACGAGRNAVWLAQRGWRVTGVDFSPVALAAARRLAAERSVDVRWIEADAVAWEPPRAAFELVLVLYLQLPPHERRAVLAHAGSALASGGTLLIVAHHSDNPAHGYGGPKDPDVLFTQEEAAADLAGLEVVRAERVLRPVDTEEGIRQAIDTLVLARAA